MRRNSWKIVMLALAITLTLTITLYGQQQQQGGAPPSWKNLKVLPKDISRPQLMGFMQAFNRALGVTCNHCHVDDKSSDEKPEKDVARAMIKMTTSLHQNASDYLPDGRDKKVNCWTCHRGSAKIELPAPPAPPQGQGGPPPPPAEKKP